MDAYRHKGQRAKLVSILKEKGIIDTRVLDAINNVPRHLFIPDTALHQFAYKNTAFPIGSGQTISHPYTVAFQTQLLNISPREKILEIGTGCGYQTAILIEMGARVYSIERQKELFTNTKKQLPRIGYSQAKLFYGDGYKGLPSFAPFDKIIVTAGAPYIPNDLLDQLKPGSCIVIPVDNSENTNQIMYRISKDLKGNLEKEEFGDFQFVPLLKEKGFDY